MGDSKNSAGPGPDHQSERRHSSTVPTLQFEQPLPVAMHNWHFGMSMGRVCRLTQSSSKVRSRISARHIHPREENMSPNSIDTVTARRSFLFGAISGGALLALPKFAKSATVSAFAQRAATGSRRGLQMAAIDSSNLPLPPVLRSRNALLRAQNIQAGETLPLTQYGTTYDYVQVARWLDADHFALGR